MEQRDLPLGQVDATGMRFAVPTAMDSGAGDTRCRADRCKSEASELVTAITERPIASSVREPQGSLQQQRGVTAGRTDVLAGGR
jgi:hypothetical protein